jgi:DNA polymerase-1
MPVGYFLRESVQLGAKFRRSGAEVEIGGFADLPKTLQAALQRKMPYLVDLLGNGEEHGPITLLRALGISAVLVETRQAARRAIRHIIKASTQHSGPLGFDIETSPKPEYAKERPWAKFNKDGAFSDGQPSPKKYRDPAGVDPHRAYIATAQIYAGGSTCFVFRGEALDLLLRSHWLRRQWLVAHNLTFEIKFLMSVGYRLPTHRKARGRVDCSEQASLLLTGIGYGGERRSLEYAANALLGIAVPKALQTSYWGARVLSPGQIAYAAIDAVIARRLWLYASRQLAAYGLLEAYELQHAAIIPVADMERRGLKLDTAAHSALVAEWSRDLASARRSYLELTGNPPPKTDEEVRSWVSGVLSPEELMAWKRTKEGGLCVDVNELGKLAHIPAARPVLDIRAKERLLTNFGANLTTKVSPATGRIHCSFWILGAKTGRFSSRDPNLQNLPSTKAPKFRECIVAEPGCLLVRADYGQIEIRVAAHRSQDTELTRQLAAGIDIHAANAARRLGVPIGEVPAIARKKAKSVAFGVLYAQSAEGLASTAFSQFGVHMSVEEAQNEIDDHRRTYPELHLYLHDHQTACRNRGYVLTASGRVIRPNWDWERLTRQDCANWPIQGDAADLMLAALRRVYWAFRKARIHGGLIATVHDELLAEVLEDDVSLTMEIMEFEMQNAFEIHFPGAPADKLIDINFGPTWSAAAKEKRKEASHVDGL